MAVVTASFLDNFLRYVMKLVILGKID